jgi:hypothetical protein
MCFTVDAMMHAQPTSVELRRASVCNMWSGGFGSERAEQEGTSFSPRARPVCRFGAGNACFLFVVILSIYPLVYE